MSTEACKLSVFVSIKRSIDIYLYEVVVSTTNSHTHTHISIHTYIPLRVSFVVAKGHTCVYTYVATSVNMYACALVLYRRLTSNDVQKCRCDKVTSC